MPGRQKSAAKHYCTEGSKRLRRSARGALLRCRRKKLPNRGATKTIPFPLGAAPAASTHPAFPLVRERARNSGSDAKFIFIQFRSKNLLRLAAFLVGIEIGSAKCSKDLARAPPPLCRRTWGRGKHVEKGGRMICANLTTTTTTTTTTS